MITIAGFQGLDLRRLPEGSDPRSARIARDVDLTLGREFECRDALVEVMPLHPQSRGLYAIGGELRAVLPGGQGYPRQAVGPVRVLYDQIGLGSGYFASVVGRYDGAGVWVIEGGEWLSNVAGNTLTAPTVTGATFSVTARVDLATITTTATSPEAVSLPPGIYPFNIAGVQRSTAAVLTTGSNRVTLIDGAGSPVTWPASVTGSTFAVGSQGTTATVTDRISDTEVQIDTTWSGASGQFDFTLSGIAEAYPLDTIIRITGVETAGANASFGVYPYLAIERWIDASDHSLGVTHEHHWIRQAATSTTEAEATQVALPFTPGPALVRIAGKLCAPDDVNGVVRFSSTANGPSDWSTENDAGYIPVITHTSGSREIESLGIYDSKLAVIFADAVQLWAMDPQPSNITLTRVIEGPGTEDSVSVVNVLGDLFYFTQGGFRSLFTAVDTGQIQENDDIGAPIYPLTKDESGATAAWWSQRRGQYLCAFGNRVYAFKYSPKAKVRGWTTWELGVPVDAAVEVGGVTYIRSGNTLYKLDPTARASVTWEVELNHAVGRPAEAFRQKRLDWIEVAQRGTSDVRVYLEPGTTQYYCDGPRLAGSTATIDRVFVGAQARSFGLRFTGQGEWTLSAIQLSYITHAW